MEKLRFLHCADLHLGCSHSSLPAHIADELTNDAFLSFEKMLANKETDKSLASMIKREYRDEKAVRSAIKRLQQGEYKIDDSTIDYNCIN